MNSMLSTVKTYLIAVKSTHVNEALICWTPSEGTPQHKQIEDVSVVVGATTGNDEREAIQKVAKNYELPESILTAFQVC